MSQQHKVRGVATTVFSDERGLCCAYHSTIVARKLPDGKTIELNNGGWHTATTRTRMNQFANEHCGGAYRVYQRDYAWFVKVGAKTIPFNEQRCVFEIGT